MSFISCWFSKKKEEDYETILSALASDIQKRQTKLSEIRLRERRATLVVTLYTLAAWVVYVSLWYMNVLPFSSPVNEGYGRRGRGWHKVLLGVPVGVGPVVILFIRRIVQIWYQRKGDAEEKTLQALRKKQRLKVEEIKKKTNYYSTHDLLRRYDESNASSPMGTPQQQKQQQRGSMAPQTPMRPVPVPVGVNGRPMMMGTPKTPVMPVPIAPPKKQWYDKLADALLGDDDSSNVPASSKYALICEKCFAHNGLVGEKVWEDVQYTCPKCGHFNPSIRSRTQSKKLSPSPSPSPISPSNLLSPASASKSVSRNSSASPEPLRRRKTRAAAGRGGDSDGEEGEGEEGASAMVVDEEESS
ncbi:hypothetical protein BDQ17DRAFT_1280535 [Cyathus striatus]|nr:hypothetical protein BDQ17DRAFT_1280535 [Cyathus striatus]